jgi:carboxypeptidase family protein
MGMRKALALATAVGLALCMALVVAAPAMAETGGIAGRVVEAEEVEPVNGAMVCAEAMPPLPVGSTCDETEGGEYEIVGLEKGQYRVHFEPPEGSRYVPQYFIHSLLKSSAHLVEVEEGSVKRGIGASFEAGGWVTGTVTDSTGFGLSEVEVCVSAKLLPEFEPRCAETDVAGKYRIEPLPPGPYTAYFSAANPRDIFPQYFGGATSAGEADDFFVFGYNETAGIDAMMELGSTISGRVDEVGSGAPLIGIRVCALTAGSGTEVGCTTTGPDGDYSIFDLPAGSYVVGFSVTAEEGGLPVLNQEDGYVRQYFDDEPSFADADAVDATQPSVYGEVDAHLVKGAEVFPRPSSGSGAAPVVTPPGQTQAPRRRALHCRRHFRARKVKGKPRCVKVHKRHRHRHHGRP